MAWMQRVGVALLAVAAVTFPAASQAQLAQRFAVELRGDFVLVGNTLARDCANDPALLLVGEVGECGASAGDSGADVLWSASADGESVVADVSVAPGEAASIAELALPEGASVTRAELYWSAQEGQGDVAAATFGRGAQLASVSAARTARARADGDDYYQSAADVTDLVRELGAGPYRVSGVDANDPVDLEDTSYYAGWWLVVIYELPGEPVRHLALYDGLGLVSDGAPIGATLGGFEVPLDGADGKLGVVAFDGDATAGGDQLRFGADAPLGADARLRGSDNFFDASRRERTGAAFGAAGDRPRASGAAGSMSGVDLHVVDVSTALEPGQTAAEVLATTSADRFFLAGLMLSVATTAADLSGSFASARDVDGPPLRPGDEIEFTIVVDNGGAAAAPAVTLRVPLPAQTAYVAGSLELSEGEGAGPLTDAVDADRGELALGAEPALVVRLGAGASASAGGRLGPGERSSVRFRVAVEPGASGSIVSQAQLGVAPEPGAGEVLTLVDGDPERAGSNPIELGIDECGGDADCSAGACDLGQSPRRCVACLDDAACPGLTPSCDANGACVCVAAPAEALCDGKDDDCDGEIDEGLAGEPCNAGSALCPRPGVSACDAALGVRCDATQPEPVELCSNGVDDDCDGAVDALDSDCAAAPDAAAAGEGPGVDPFDPGPARTPSAGRAPPRRGSAPAASGLGGGGGCGLARGVAAGVEPWPWWLGAAALACARRRRARYSSSVR